MSLSNKTKKKVMRILLQVEGLSKWEYTQIHNEMFGYEKIKKKGDLDD